MQKNIWDLHVRFIRIIQNESYSRRMDMKGVILFNKTIILIYKELGHVASEYIQLFQYSQVERYNVMNNW
jgi:hypothetical protein